MFGGIFQLIAYGAQEIYLTNPNKKHDNLDDLIGKTESEIIELLNSYEDSETYSQLFCDACRAGELQIMRIIYDLYEIDIHENDDALFKSICLRSLKNQMIVLQWLYSLGGYNIDQLKKGFIEMFRYNNCSIDVANWLYNLITSDSILVDMNILNEAYEIYCRSYFIRLETIQWFYDKGVNIFFDNEFFINQCNRNNTEICEWLCSVSNNYDFTYNEKKHFITHYTIGTVVTETNLNYESEDDENEYE